MGNEVQINVVLNDSTSASKDAIKADYVAWATDFEPIEIRFDLNDDWRAQFAAALGSVEGESIDIPVTTDAKEVAAQVQQALDAVREDSTIEVPLEAGSADGLNAEVMRDIENIRTEAGAIIIPIEAQTTGLATAQEQLLAEQATSQLNSAVNAAQEGAAIEVPLVVANAGAFAAQVMDQVAEVQTEVGSIEVPVEANTEGLAAAREQAPIFGSGMPYAEYPYGMGALGMPGQLGLMGDTAFPSMSGSLSTEFESMFQSMSGILAYRPDYTPAPLYGGGTSPYAGANARIQQMQLPSETMSVTATNPINDAWIAQVKASLKSVANDALSIPVNPDLEGFEAQLESTLADLSQTTKADIPIDVGDAMIFREQVETLVEQVQSSVKAVIDVQINNEGALTELQEATVGASQATLDLVNAQQKLNEAMASGDEDAIAKARAEVVTATKEESAAAQELAESMDAAGASEVAAGDAAKGIALSMQALNEAMGPLWMVMNVAQIAMMGFYSSSNSASTGASDLSQQLIGLGQSGANAAQQLTGNDALKSMANDLTGAGTSAAEFAQAYSGSVTDAEAYTQKLVDSQQQAGAAVTSVSQQMESATSGGKASSESMTASLQTTSVGVEQLAQRVNSGTVSIGSLSQANQDAVTHYNQLTSSVNAAQQALSDMQEAQSVTLEQLYSSSGSFDTEAQAAHAFGLSLNDVEQAYDSIKLANPKDTVDQISQAFDSSISAAEQAAQAITTAMQQEQQAVTQAQQAVDNAYNSLGQSGQAVANAQHGVQQAEEQYTNSLDAEQTAQAAVATARQQAAQQLIDLALQQKDAAAAALSANVALFDAQQSAAALGVTPGNAQAIASEQITTANEAQVKAAIALIEAENQVADAQNTSTQATQSLNTAQQEGIDNNPAVIAANKALVQAQQQVQQADYAVTQAHEQVTQAAEAQQQAAEALTAAQQQLTTAQNNERDATNLATVSGQQHLQMVLQLDSAIRGTGLPTQTQYNMLIQDTAAMFNGSTSAAEGYLKQIGLIPQDFKFVTTAVAQVDWSQIEPLVNQLHISPANLMNANGGYIAGAGGPKDDAIPSMLSNGEFVVNAAATSQHRGLLEGINAGHYADGGIVSGNAIGAEFGAAYQDAVDTLHIMGIAGAPSLPAYTASAGSSGGMPVAGGVSGSRAQNEAIMQNVFASMFGWTGQQWADAYQLEMMEAGFNNTAQNPTSTAYGMGQFLNSTWASYGIAKTSDPTQQSIGMGRYIAARYGSPAGALAHEHAFHWYAAGGPANGLVGIGDGGPEAVQLPNGSTVLPAANTAALGAGPAPVTDVVMTFAGTVNNAFAILIMQMVRTGQIQLNVNGARVRAG